ncbi:MAG: DnaD domain protein [Clostridia bacterium]|nr:DnaD domain protein [Clostridia bacterium]
MPNRLIKDSIHESEKVNKLSDFQFRVWVNLITYVDDYGRGDARPAIIKGRCFPLRDEIKAADIGVALQQLAASGCIRLYCVDGMRYLYFPNWDDHQRIRTKVSKFPSPDNSEAVVDNPLQSAADGGNSPQNVPLNPNPNPNPNTNPEAEVEGGGAAADNPFGDPSSAAPFIPDPLVIYASNNLLAMNGDNMDELLSFRDSLPDDLIRHAINEACGAGVRHYKYVKAILNRYVDAGFKTIADVRADEEKRQRSGQEPKQYADEDDFY